MRISSQAFSESETIPREFTCAGQDKSPRLEIDDVPDDTRTLAVIMDDPDAPGGTFVHWLLWNVPAERTELPEGLPDSDRVESIGGAVQGRNSFDGVGYGGPCPPDGPAHHYRFNAYALDVELDVQPGAQRKSLERAMDGHILAETRLTGLFQKEQ